MDYTPEIIRSRRRTLSVEISRDLRVIVRAPLRLPQREIARFLSERAGWIEEHLARARRRLAAAADLPKLTDAEQQELRRRAKETIPARVEFFAGRLGVSFGRISYRFQLIHRASLQKRKESPVEQNHVLIAFPAAKFCRSFQPAYNVSRIFKEFST